MNNCVALILTPFVVFFTCVGVFFYREEQREKKRYGIGTQKAFDIEREAERNYVEARIEHVKQIEELIQSVAKNINELYRMYDISVSWQYNDEIHNYAFRSRTCDFPSIKLIVEHKHIPKKMAFAYSVYYIDDLMVEKKMNGATSELFKSITKHIDEYKNEIKGLMPVVEVINNEKCISGLRRKPKSM